MAPPTDNETWLIQTGDSVIQKQTRSGMASLSPWEKLVYCLWATDYGMRNAGDLDAAADVYPEFHSDARRAAKELSLRLTREAFSLSPDQFEREYFDRFESICAEIRRAQPGAG